MEPGFFSQLPQGCLSVSLTRIDKAARHLPDLGPQRMTMAINQDDTIFDHGQNRHAGHLIRRHDLTCNHRVITDLVSVSIGQVIEKYFPFTILGNEPPAF